MLRHALILAAAGGVAGVAHAASHTINSSTPTPILLSSNFNGSFDVRPFLGSNSRVTQASILLSFIDDVEQFRLITLPRGGFVKTGVETLLQQQYAGVSYTTRQIEMLQTVRNQITDTTGEQVTVTLPGDSRSAGTQSNANNLLVDTQSKRTFVRRNCLDYLIYGSQSLCTLEEVFYTDTINEYYGKAGAFDIQFDPLGPQALTDLNADGLLNFTGVVNAGDARLLLAQMRFDVQSVPEPSLLALLGIGGLLLQRQRLKRQR